VAATSTANGSQLIQNAPLLMSTSVRASSGLISSLRSTAA
jgi:hypothetical protein